MSVVAKVNAALRARGRLERLVRGRGYFYFHGGNAHNWPTCTVWVFRANDLTVERWLEEFDHLRMASESQEGGWL